MVNTKDIRVKLYISKCKQLIVIGCEVKYFNCIILHHPEHQKFYEEFDMWTLNRSRFNETNLEAIKKLNLIDVKKLSIIERILIISDIITISA